MYSYAISRGEGTLIDYGTCDYIALKILITWCCARKKDGTIMMFGNADGTGE
jgi:hypothetical protein